MFDKLLREKKHLLIMLPRITSFKLTSLLILVFFLTTLLAPIAIFNKLFFALLAVTFVLRVLLRGTFSLPTFSPFIVCVIFFYGFVLSFQTNSDYNLSMQLLSSVATLFLIYILYDSRVDIEKVIKISGVIMGLTTLLLYMVFTRKIDFYGMDQLKEFFLRYGVIAVGEKNYTGNSIFFIRLGSVPFIFLPACLFFKECLEFKKLVNILAVLLMMFVIIISGSRGLIFSFILGVFTILYFRQRLVGRILLVICSVTLAVVVLTYISAETTIISINDPSNNIKVGHIISFVDNLNLLNICFGGGLAAYYYSIGVSEYVAQTEITLLDMLRYFGVFLTVVLYMSLIFPVASINAYTGRKKEYLVLFLIYLVASMTNPILFNSFGLIVVLWYWSKIIESNKIIYA